MGGCPGVAMQLVMRCVWMPRCSYEVANVLCVVFRVLLCVANALWVLLCS